MKFRVRPCVTVPVLLSLFLFSCGFNKPEFLVLPDTVGPEEESPKIVEHPADWKDFSGGETSRLAFLLTDPDSAWLGLVHGMKSFGIPFLITDSVDEALMHDVVLVYPRIDRKVVKDEDLKRFEKFVVAGGALLAVNVLAEELEDLFGFHKTVRERTRAEVEYEESPLTGDFIYPEERRIRIGNPERPKTLMHTFSYEDPQSVLARYDDESAAIIQHPYGRGITYAFGFDLGLYIKKAHNNRDEEASRTYVNDFEPSVDTVLRLIKEMYRAHEDDAFFLHTAPDGFPLSVIISHDVDYSGSLANSIAYAEYERSMNYGATYFMQTKYFQDYFDEIFFDDRTSELLNTLKEMGMELGSHSVCHTDMLAYLPQGSGKEKYPDYQPRIIEMQYTRDATIMGELRVSKFLIEHFSGVTVDSFRPGFLAHPFSLPQSLESTGYRYSSSVTANDVLTHLPYRQTFNRLYKSETSIFEFPITVEDEKDPPMDRRVDEAVELAEKIARYGGLYVVLIHPNVTDHKLRFLEELTPRLRDWTWFGTHKEFGDWWAARDGIEADLVVNHDETFLRISTDQVVKGLGIDLPDGLVPADDSAAAKSGDLYIFDFSAGTTEVMLTRRDTTEQKDQEE